MITVKICKEDDEELMDKVDAKFGRPVKLTLWHTPKTCAVWNLSLAQAQELVNVLSATLEKQAA